MAPISLIEIRSLFWNGNPGNCPAGSPKLLKMTYACTRYSLVASMKTEGD
jgi:hypothetical protein